MAWDVCSLFVLVLLLVILCLLRFGLKSLCAKVLVPGMVLDVVWARLEEVLPTFVLLCAVTVMNCLARCPKQQGCLRPQLDPSEEHIFYL